MINSLLNKEKEFLIIKHRVLNNPNPEFEQKAEEIAKLQEYTGQRKPVSVFEGDLIEMKDGTVVLVHKSFFAPSIKKLKAWRSEGHAAYLDEVLDKAADCSSEIGLCLEPRGQITLQGIEKTIKAVQAHDLNRVYFDSFFGKRLDYVIEVNERLGTNYPVSYHAAGSLGSYVIPLFLGIFEGMKKEPDIFTIPSSLAFGKFNKPFIYGTVGSVEKLEELAQNPNALGVYLRTKEKSSVKMLFNSLCSRKRT